MLEELNKTNTITFPGTWFLGQPNLGIHLLGFPIPGTLHLRFPIRVTSILEFSIGIRENPIFIPII